MLKTLTVWNFALLEQVQIEFDQGLNILTGETGAGKSILIDSLGAVLGHRMTQDAIRTGCDWLRVEAVFYIDGQLELHAFLKEQAIDDEEDTLIITRQITRSGRNMILVNGCHVTLAVLKSLGEFLVDIHGQNENLALLRIGNQFRLLDGTDPAIGRQHQVYRKAYDRWMLLRQKLEDKESKAREYAQRLDMLQWQFKEIEDARLQENEDELLEQQIRKLSNAEKIAGFVENSYELMAGGGKNPVGVLGALAEIRQNLVSMSRFDTAMEESRQMVEEAACQLQEVAYNLRDYGEDMEFDPHKLDSMQQRMDVIYKLRKKYGATIADVLQHQQKVRTELDEIENYDEDIADLQKEISAGQQSVQREAEKLTKLRQSAAARLSAAIGEQLMSLGMPHAQFHIRLSALDKFTDHGADGLTMLFSANVGEQEKPVQKIASGGELSRIALAIKTVAAAREDSAVGSMVFDEIDTGIGGRTAQMVAERIAVIAAHKQVLCITHLPQIACMADVHLYISKGVEGQETVTNVRRLTKGEQVNEIARMASGIDVTAASLDNAREMIDNAKMKRQRL